MEIHAINLVLSLLCAFASGTALGSWLMLRALRSGIRRDPKKFLGNVLLRYGLRIKDFEHMQVLPKDSSS